MSHLSILYVSQSTRIILQKFDTLKRSKIKFFMADITVEHNRGLGFN